MHMDSLMKSAGLGGVRRDMDRLIDSVFESGWRRFPAAGEWSPSMDVSETKDALLVKAEVPGMDSNDISVTIQENMLTVHGEKREEKEEKDERYHRSERSY